MISPKQIVSDGYLNSALNTVLVVAVGGYLAGTVGTTTPPPRTSGGGSYYSYVSPRQPRKPVVKPVIIEEPDLLIEQISREDEEIVAIISAVILKCY
jgi:hypothetical protein